MSNSRPQTLAKQLMRSPQSPGAPSFPVNSPAFWLVVLTGPPQNQSSPDYRKQPPPPALSNLQASLVVRQHGDAPGLPGLRVGQGWPVAGPTSDLIHLHAHRRQQSNKFCVCGHKNQRLTCEHIFLAPGRGPSQPSSTLELSPAPARPA